MCRKFLTTTSSLKHGMEVGSALPTTSTGFYNERHSKSEKTFILKIQRPRRQPCDGGRERRWGTSHGSWKHHERPQSIQVTLLGISEPGSSYQQGASRFSHLLQISFPTGSSFPQTSSTSCWPSGPRGSSGNYPVHTFAFCLFVHLECIFSTPLYFSCTALHFNLIVPAFRHSFLAQYDIYNVATGRLVNETF